MSNKARAGYANRWADLSNREALMTKEEHIERLSQWLENWLLPTLSGNEAVGLRQQIAEAREAAQQSVQSDCEHEWVSTVNKVIVSGEYCRKCHTVRYP